MMDSKTKTYPDFTTIIHTFRRKLTHDDMELCKQMFQKLFQVHLEEGYVNEHVYDECGFPMDTDIDGKIVLIPATEFTHESFQRAKRLSHVNQRGKRKHLYVLHNERKQLKLVCTEVITNASFESLVHPG